MIRLLALILSLVALAALPRSASAQEADLSGAWSGETPGQGGSNYNTLMLNSDGTFVRVSRAPNGWMLRYEGVYSVRSAGPNEMLMQSEIQRWAPTAMCSQIASMNIVNCQPVSHPPPSSARVTIVSPTQIDINGLSLFRDQNPTLLNAAVPARYVQNEVAPAQPTMPTLHPYDQSGVHKGMSDFIYGRLRGCNYKSTGSAGTLYSGCDR